MMSQFRIINSIIGLLLSAHVILRAQIVPPYIQHFDSVNCTGWTHGAITGTDDWQRGIPSGVVLNSAASAPNVWATKLNGNTTSSSVMYLVTPSFDLSNLTKVYQISFSHRYQTTNNLAGCNVEYSTNGGLSWLLLNGTLSQKISWYNNVNCSSLGGQSSWSGNSFGGYNYPAHSLISLQGQSNVKFRFKYGNTNATGKTEGWIIDDFSITETAPDVIATSGTKFIGAKNFATFTVSTTFVYNSIGPPTYSNVTNYYFSYDSIFDASDALIGTKSHTVNSTISPYTHTMAMLPNLKARNYWVFYRHDATNNLVEANENNNVGCMVLQIDTTFNIPEHKEDFEGTVNYWKPSGVPLYWVKGKSNVHQIEGTHSGNKSWYIKNPNYSAPFAPVQYLESPYFDFSAQNNNVICFWLKAKSTFTSNPSKFGIELSATNSLPSFSTPTFFPMPRFNDWDCNCFSLSSLNGQNNAKIRFVHSDMMSFEFFQQNINLDDIYIGQPKPDLSIEHTYTINTNSSLVTDTLYYRLFNGGAGSSSNSTTEFYWSTDSLLDASDLFLGSVAEPSISSLGFLNQKFVFSKPTTSNGYYFIIYKVDVTGAINEMWESNNLGYYRLKQESIYSVPYFNDFETQANGWWHNSTIGLDSWKLGTPTGTILNTAFSGTSAFSTTQLSPLPKMSRAHLYSPIFDFTTIADPVLEMDMKLHYRTKYTFESQMNLSYSIDGGATWKVLDTTSSSFNRWYYPMTFNTWAGIDVEYSIGNVSHLLFSGAEKAFPSTYEYNSRDVDRNTRYNVDIAFLAGKPHVQFRFNIGSAKNDSTLITGYSDLEGAIMDNFSINGRVVDLFVPYKKHLMISSNKQKLGFSMYIKNSGNYISYTTTNKFYVSTDTILDASDFYLGEDTMKGIRPEFKRYINKTFNSPANLSNYNYLIYQLDVPNFNAEKNENNNVGYWPLSLDSIKTLPYLMDFNDTIVNGWYEFLTGPFTGNLIQDQWRFRNIRGIMEPLNTPQRQTGTMFTEAINNNIHVSQVPFWYLESPAFNFSNYNNLQLSFKLFVYASAVSGGNLEYSLNGGNTWSVLTPSIPSQGYNWYNSPSLSYLSAPGWNFIFKPIVYLDSAWINIGFLSGQPSVVFRYKFKDSFDATSNYASQGMSIDNFRITGSPITLNVDTKENKGFINVYSYDNEVYINYGILNDANREYEIKIINLTGQVLSSQKQVLNTGVNIYNIPINLSDGVYIITLENSKQLIRQKINYYKH